MKYFVRKKTKQRLYLNRINDNTCKYNGYIKGTREDTQLLGFVSRVHKKYTTVLSLVTIWFIISRVPELSTTIKDRYFDNSQDVAPIFLINNWLKRYTVLNVEDVQWTDNCTSTLIQFVLNNKYIIHHEKRNNKELENLKSNHRFTCNVNCIINFLRA